MAQSPNKGPQQGPSGRKFKKNKNSGDGCDLINPVIENQFDYTSKENPQKDRLIARLDSLTSNGDAAALANWIQQQDWLQISQCLMQQVVVEGVCRMTPLHGMALFIKHRSEAPQESVDFVIQSYVKAGCDVNNLCNDLRPRRRSRLGFTPLLLAIEQKNTAVMRALIKAGADVNQCDTGGFSPLHWAVIASLDVEVFEDLVRAGADMRISKANQEGTSPPPVLHTAVDDGRVGIVSFLLENLVDINTVWPYSVLAESSWDKLKSRYDCGLLENQMNRINISAIGRAVRMRKMNVLDLLLRQPEARVSIDDLHFCILEGDSRVANIILDHMDKESFISTDKINEKWALHYLGPAAFRPTKYEEDSMGQTIQLIRTYMQYGFDINSVSDMDDDEQIEERSTLLIRAVILGHNDLVRFLIDNGALNISVISTFDVNESPLHAAIGEHWQENRRNSEALLIFARAGFDFSQKYQYPPKEVLRIVKVVRPLTAFEKVLTIRAGKNEAMVLLQAVDTILEKDDTKVTEIHVPLAMMGLNMGIVLLVLEKLPQELSLKGWTVTERKIPMLQWLLNSVIKSWSHCPMLGINMKGFISVAKIFKSKGYNLNDFQKVNEYRFDISTASIHCIGLCLTDPNMELFNFLMDIPTFDWKDCDFMYALRLYITEPHVKSVRFHEVLLRLLHKGVSLKNQGHMIPLFRPELVDSKCVHLMKRLWWAGVDFKEFEYILMDKTISNDASENEEGKRALIELKDWLLRIAKVPCLSRLAAIAVRQSMKCPDLESLSIPRHLKMLIQDIPAHLA